MVLFLQFFLLMFKSIDFFLVFADTFQKFSIGFLSLDEFLNKLICFFYRGILLDVSEG